MSVGMQAELERDLAEGRIAFSPEGEPYATSTWRPKDLEPIKRGEIIVASPAFMARTDGERLIYPGRTHSFWGPSESLKSWAALLACRSVLEEGKTALYIDFEDDAVSFVERARTAGISDDAIGTRLRYARPEEPLTPNASGWDLKEAERTLAPALVVIDGVSEVFALHGWDAFSVTDTAKYHALLLGGFEDAATLEIDHTAKTEGRGQYGSMGKKAGLTGASYEFRVGRSEGRGGHSTARVIVDKDRQGHVRHFATGGMVGVFHLDTTGREPRVYLEAPDDTDPAERVRDRVGEWLAENPRSPKRAVRSARLGKHADVDEALDSLVADGLAVVESGPRGAHLYSIDGVGG